MVRDVSLIFFGDKWDDMWRRRQQLASRLSESGMVDKVIYVEQPLTLFSLAKYLVGRRHGLESTVRWSRVFSNRSFVFNASDRVSVLTPVSPLPTTGSWILNAMDGFFRHHVQAWMTKRLMAKLRIKDTILWVSLPTLPKGLLKEFRPRLTWYDCTEDFSEWTVFPPQARRTIRTNDEDLSRSADVVSTVSRELYDRKRAMNARVHWIPNAVDAALFVDHELGEPPEDLRDIRRPRLVSVGAIDAQSDWELLEYVIETHANWSIVLIGPASLPPEIMRRFGSCGSVHLLGQKPYEQLPSYLVHSDVCIQFYKQDLCNSTRNSQKQFLYLASGKPIVSTKTADINTIAEVVSIAETKEAFVSLLEKALAEEDQILRLKRIEMARVNSWPARVAQIARIIEECLQGD